MLKINLKKYESTVGTLGNILEWYNFGLFMPFLHILSSEFLPIENATYREILSFLALSIGLFMRPLGAAIFGPIGDKFGRQKAISISILLMAIPTFCMGLLPNYNQIGVWAPILLVFLRALQGISLGGEYTAAMVHLVEKAPSNRRSFYGSLSDAGSQVGVLLGSQSLLLLYKLFSNDEVYSFAWRIPFLLAILLIPFAFLVPSNIFSPKNKPVEPIFKTLKMYKKEIGCTVAITAFSAIGFYTLLTFFPYYLTDNKILLQEDAAACSLYSTLVMTIAILVAGYLADRYGKKFFMILGIIGVTLITYPMFMTSTRSFDHWLALQLVYGVCIGCYYSSRAAFFSEAFPAEVRCTAVSLSLSLAQAIFGGLTPLILSHAVKISSFLSVIPITLMAICAIYALIILKGKNMK
ncbi:MAG: MFS transporter [Holosporaceae bacterium]|nr:MFS transporter [Holosporaceae bacterium]